MSAHIERKSVVMSWDGAYSLQRNKDGGTQLTGIHVKKQHSFPGHILVCLASLDPPPLSRGDRKVQQVHRSRKGTSAGKLLTGNASTRRRGARGGLKRAMGKSQK